jgi:protein O-GlcNAc transferase
LDALNRRLTEVRHSALLFDAEKYSRHLEAGYSMIYERHQAGVPAEHITVPS